MAVPSGTVTFLFTDIEGSTRLWQQDEVAMRSALERHDTVLRSAIDGHGGYVFATGGDGFGAAFGRAGEAVAAAVEAQAGLAAEPWPEGAPIRVRMGLHTGEVAERDGDYFGTPVNQTARLMAVGHGGQVLCSAVTAGLLGAEVKVVDLGEHRVRDLSAPQRVFQVGDGRFPALRSLDALPGNLPSLTSSFVGREVELATVAKELGAARLVTLTGVGGVGKTRLALQVAAELLPGFADGVWVCELAAAANGDDMAEVVAAALGVVPRAQMTLPESIADFLRTRQMLVVLDNCEHLLDEAAGLAEMILGGAAGVRILTTSREGLGLPDERVRPLRSLAVSTELPESSEAVVLFGERARAVDPDFAVDATSVAAVAEICRRLDGIPLAIELAAARVSGMGAAEIAGHLDERFRLLTGGGRGRDERHQTLRAAIEWSYALLTDAERTVFDRLGVFPASFDEAAAVAVCATDGIGRWDVIDALSGLAAKSMIGLERSGDTGRYQLLETLRHFARDQAGASAGLDGLRRRHAQFYAEFAERAGAGAMSADELVWRPRLAAETDNLRAATGWAFEAAALDDVAVGVRILAGLAVEALWHPSSGILAWASAGLLRADELEADQRAVVLGLAAFDASCANQPDQAITLGNRALADSVTFGAGLVVALGAVSVSTVATGDPAEALAMLARGLARLDAEGASDWRAVYVSGLTSALASSIGEYNTAQSGAERALVLARQIGAPTLLAQALTAYAIAFEDDHPDEALAAADESIHLTETGAGDLAYPMALCLGATIRAVRGDHPDAARALRTAIAHQARIADNLALSVIPRVALVVATHPDFLEAAATLAGALSEPMFAFSPAVVSRRQRDDNDQRLADIAAALGTRAYTNAEQQGAAMTPDEVVAYATDQLSRLANI